MTVLATDCCTLSIRDAEEKGTVAGPAMQFGWFESWGISAVMDVVGIGDVK